MSSIFSNLLKMSTTLVWCGFALFWLDFLNDFKIQYVLLGH